MEIVKKVPADQSTEAVFRKEAIDRMIGQVNELISLQNPENREQKLAGLYVYLLSKRSKEARFVDSFVNEIIDGVDQADVRELLKHISHLISSPVEQNLTIKKLVEDGEMLWKIFGTSTGTDSLVRFKDKVSRIILKGCGWNGGLLEEVPTAGGAGSVIKEIPIDSALEWRIVSEMMCILWWLRVTAAGPDTPLRTMSQTSAISSMKRLWCANTRNFCERYRTSYTPPPTNVNVRNVTQVLMSALTENSIEYKSPQEMIRFTDAYFENMIEEVVKRGLATAGAEEEIRIYRECQRRYQELYRSVEITSGYLILPQNELVDYRNPETLLRKLREWDDWDDDRKLSTQIRSSGNPSLVEKFERGKVTTAEIRGVVEEFFRTLDEVLELQTGSAHTGQTSILIGGTLFHIMFPYPEDPLKNEIPPFDPRVERWVRCVCCIVYILTSLYVVVSPVGVYTPPGIAEYVIGYKNSLTSLIEPPSPVRVDQITRVLLDDVE